MTEAQVFYEDVEPGDAIPALTVTVDQTQMFFFSAATYNGHRIHYDKEWAREVEGYDDVICPPLYLQYCVLPVTPLQGLRPDGSTGSASGSLAFPRAPRRMAGGESTTFHLPAYHRDEIDMVRTIESIVEKHGRSGRFVLVTWHTSYRNQRRDLVAEATMSMIARP